MQVCSFFFFGGVFQGIHVVFVFGFCVSCIFLGDA